MTMIANSATVTIITGRQFLHCEPSVRFHQPSFNKNIKSLKYATKIKKNKQSQHLKVMPPATTGISLPSMHQKNNYIVR